MTKAEIQKKLKAATDEMAAILAKPEMSAEDDARYQELEAEAEQCKTDLEAVREQEKVNAERKTKLGALQGAVGQMSPRLTKATQPGSPNITRQRMACEDDPNGGFRTHREFHLAVMNASITGNEDERLLPLKAAVGSDEHSTFSDAYGGYLQPEGFIPGLKSVMAETDPTVGRVTTVPMSAQVVNMNAKTDKNHTTSVSGGLVVYRREEAGSVSSSRMQMEGIKLEATTLMGLTYATEEVLERSPISFASLIADGFGQEFGSKIIREKLRGTGVGQLEGILNTPCLITQDAEEGQSANTVLYKNVIKMRSRCWRYSNAVWLYNHDTLPELMNMADDYGRPVWQTSAREGEPDMLLGRPAFPSEYCSTVGDVGDLILGNWSEYLYGVLDNVRSAESPHVRFVEHERAFKYWMTNAGKVWWRTALTPAKSSTTLSPFVVLEAR